MSALRAGLGLAALFGACSLAAVGLVEDEGWLTRAYPDPARPELATACAGVTGPQIKAGAVYSDDACVALTAQALLEHAVAIRPCLPAEIPTETHAAFIRFAYNVGPSAFCGSTLSRKARAGDLKGACAELDRWTKAAGRTWLGLVKRRSRERLQCEAGLK
jgi:lysozyme